MGGPPGAPPGGGGGGGGPPEPPGGGGGGGGGGGPGISTLLVKLLVIASWQGEDLGKLVLDRRGLPQEDGSLVFEQQRA